VAAKMAKAAAISAATIISVGIDVLPSFREHHAGKSDDDFDPDQICGHGEMRLITNPHAITTQAAPSTAEAAALA
jgi:hypothetical protein